MALIYGDRVKETSSTTGTGTMTLAGPSASFRSFAAGVGVGNECYYGIVHTVDNTWEVGRGTVGAGTLARNTVYASSNSNLLVNFAVGTKVLFTTSPAIFHTQALDATSHGAIDHTAAPLNLLNAVAHGAVDHTAAPLNLLNAAGHQAVDHTAAPFNLLNATAHQGIDHTAAPFNLLNAAGHQAIDHTAAPFNLLNAAGHQAIDHTAGPFNLLSVTGHQGVSHTGAPFNLLDAPAHALINHTGIPGVGGKFVQQVFASNSGIVNANVLTPEDNTIPQITEGTFVAAVTITPTNIANTLVFDFQCSGYLAPTSGAERLYVMLFQGAGPNALATVPQATGDSTGQHAASFIHYLNPSASGSPITYNIYIGVSVNPYQVNGDGSGNPLFGGTRRATLTVTEVTP